MPDRWTLKTPLGDLELNATFHAPKYQPGGVDLGAVMRRDDHLAFQRSGDGLATPGPLRLVGRVWRDDHDIAALVDELRDLREAVAACTQVVRSTGQGTYVYDQLAGGPPPAISPDGLGGFTVEIELWPGEAEPTYVPVIALRYVAGKSLANASSISQLTFTPLAEAQPGDLLIVGLAANATFEGFTDWDGWTHLHTAIAQSTLLGRESVLAHLIVPDPVPASWTWQWNNSTAVAGAMALYRDQDEDEPIARDAWQAGPSTPANVTVALGSAAFAFFRQVSTASGPKVPEGMTPIVEGLTITNAAVAAGAEDNLPAGAYVKSTVMGAGSSSSVVIINRRGAPEPPPPVYGPIELVGFQNTSGSSSTNRTIPVPTGAGQDDILVTVIAYNSNGGSYVDLQGFTPALQMRYAASSNRWTDVLWRALPATPPASYTIATSNASAANITTFAFRNVDPVNPILDADWDEATGLVHPLPTVMAEDGAAAIGVWRATIQTLPDGDPEMTFVASGGGTNIQRYVGYELGLAAGPYSRSRSAGSGVARTYNRGVVLLRKR